MAFECVLNKLQSGTATNISLEYDVSTISGNSATIKTPVNNDSDSEAAKAETAGEPPSSSYDSQAMPVPKITHDWYQTETQVVIEIRIKKLAANMVQVMFVTLLLISVDVTCP